MSLPSGTTTSGDAAPPSTARRGIVGYEPALDPEIYRFNREGYPERREDWVEPRWRWMFLEAAARLGVRPMVWMYRAPTGIVAHQGAIPVRLWVAGRELTTGWFVETMVLESHRKKGVGPMVIKKALEDLPVNLSLGQTSDMRALQFALGWVQVAPLDEYVFVLDAGAVLEGKVSSIAKPLAALALRGRQRLRARSASRVSAVDVREVPRYGGDHDDLWARVRSAFSCAVVRDASYLNWKYVDQPGQSFTRLDVRSGGRLVGTVVTATRRHDPGYAYARGLIVDLVVDPGDAAAVRGVLHAACDHLRRDGAALVRFDLLNGALARQILAFGFERRGAERVLLVSTLGADADTVSRMTMADGWLVSAGDSDIDRPW